MKSINKFAYDWKAEKGEVNSGEYLVEEEKCLSIKEIAERFALGYPIEELNRGLDAGEEFDDEDINNVHQPIYDNDEMDNSDLLRQMRSSVAGAPSGAPEQNEEQHNKDQNAEQESGESNE